MGYTWNINSLGSPSAPFQISSAVDTGHLEPKLSPIDHYISKNRELMRLLIDPNNFEGRLDNLKSNNKIRDKAYLAVKGALITTSQISPVLANLVLLGHVSAVESYLRAIFRGLVQLDEPTRLACIKKELSFGAVLLHDKESMPDAMLEYIALSGKNNIEDLLKDYIGIKGASPKDLANALIEFDKVCQMRHCIVHKFGTVGAHNIKHDPLGNKALVNKPIKNDFHSIQSAALVCWNCVHLINQYVWSNVMYRLIADGSKKRNPMIWTIDWKKDQHKFKRYFELFNATLAMTPNAGVKNAYSDYCITYGSLS